MVENIIFQPYKWETTKNPSSRYEFYVHGLTQENKKVCCRIQNFYSYVYIKLHDKIDAKNKLLHLKKELHNKTKNDSWLSDNFRKIKAVQKHQIYYYHKSNYVYIEFNKQDCLYRLKRWIKQIEYDYKPLDLSIHEDKATPEMKLFAKYGIKPSGWLEINCEKDFVERNNIFSSSEINITCSVDELIPRNDIHDVINPKIISYDIECVSDNKSGKSFPNPTKKYHPIISISATVGYHNQQKDDWMTYAFVNSSGNRKIPYDLGEHFKVINCNNELNLLNMWFKFIREQNPEIIISFNGLSFDDMYVYERLNLYQNTMSSNIVSRVFNKLGRLHHVPTRMETMEWESSAYGKQRYYYFDIPGVIHFDMYVYAKKNFGNLPSYKLDALSEKFLNEKKVDLPIPKMTRYYYDNTPEKMLEIIKYCNQDTILPFMLMKKWMVLYSLQEMSNVVNVSMSNLLIRGQSIKVYSQIYKLCNTLDIVVSSKGTDYVVDEENKEQDYQGATVQTPMSGYWKRVATFDFKSLYPTTIIAYNLCFSTYIPPDVPESELNSDDYNVFEFEEHQGCEHDTIVRKSKQGTKVICRKNKYKFYKSSVRKGIICQLLENLLESRANTRKEIKKFKKQLEKTNNPVEKKNLELKIALYDCRQLQYKVSANSMYGFVGSLISPLPFYPVASTTTYLGRENIDKSIQFMKKEIPGTKTVYGDTDSCFIYFPNFKNVYEAYKGCEKLEEKVNEIFPKPMYLELEKVYSDLFLLSKKRYIGFIVDENNKLLEIDKKGIVLKRRDNCQFIKNAYQEIINLVMKEAPKGQFFKTICRQIMTLLEEKVPPEKLLIGSSVNGGYKVNGTREPFSKIIQREVDVSSIKLPQVQVAVKMFSRGSYVQAGDRIDYIIMDNGYKKAYMKAENYEYYMENKYNPDVKIDYFYYLSNKYANPIDEILEVKFGLQKPINKLVKLLEKQLIQKKDIPSYFMANNFRIRNKQKDKNKDIIINKYYGTQEFVKPL